MELEQLLRFARAYNDAGWAIQMQLNDIAEGRHGDLNPNALKYIARTFHGYSDDLDVAISRALEANDGQDR